MSTIDVSGAASDLTNSKFISQVGAIVAGSMASTVTTEFARRRILDINVRGGDALYSLGTAFLMLVIGRSSYLGRAVALGAASTAGSVVIEQVGVV